jgi:hypothetical protein
MERAWLVVLPWLGVSIIVAAIVCGIAASLLRVGPRKGKLQFAASLLIGAVVCVAPMLSFVIDQRRPVFEAAGYIRSATVYRAGRYSDRTAIQIQMASGAVAHVNAWGRSPYFRPGERIEATYKGYTGSIVRAKFYSASGALEGQFYGASSFGYFLACALGLFLMWAAVVKYRRDPEGAEVRGRQTAPASGVDTASLMNLSNRNT